MRQAYLIRGAWLWVAARALAGMIFLLASANPIRFSPVVSVALVAAIILLSYIDLRRRGESNLLHNLGIPAVVTVALATLPAVAGESAMAILGAVIK